MNLDASTIKKAGATITLGGAVSAAALFGLLDQRYAMATDVQALTTVIQEDRIDELEYKIEEAERQEANIMRVPLDERPEWVDQELLQIKNRKDRYIRKLDRLLGEER